MEGSVGLDTVDLGDGGFVVAGELVAGAGADFDDGAVGLGV